jgi:hypothetical protein
MLTREQLDYLKTLPGGEWGSEVKKQALYSLVKKAADEFPDTTLLSVELGVFGGGGVLPIAAAHKDLKCGFAFGVDSWDNIAPLEGTNTKENSDWWATVDINSVYDSFRAACLSEYWVGYIFHLKGRTDEFVDSFRDGSITLLHQDSNHASEVIIKELELWSPKMKIGGYWVVDDTSWPSTQLGYSKLPDFGFELVEQFDTWAIYKKVK